MECIKLWARNGDAVRQAIELVHLDWWRVPPPRSRQSPVCSGQSLRVHSCAVSRILSAMGGHVLHCVLYHTGRGSKPQDDRRACRQNQQNTVRSAVRITL